MKFYLCNHCGNIATKLTDKNVDLSCCGSLMEQMSANITDAAVEKHKPVYTIENDVVEVIVGSALHPMTEEHFIEWIVVETKSNTYIKKLNPNEEPKAMFNIKEEILSIYAYCNLHGLWK